MPIPSNDVKLVGIMKIKIVVSLLAILLLGASFGSAYYFYDKYQKVQKTLDNPELMAQKEVESIVAKLGELIMLPEGEEPSVATVLDRDKLADQPFFAQAENGDKVVIYTKAQKAILYRVEAHKIIEVAPISMTQPETPMPETETTE
ncbi:MAG: hypothetical protein ACD_40C00069G0001 [uncultured bacterium]|nr:MAG: hypothetical protein ACD_40C00069G0001 [uncultured bacterium]